MVVLKYHISIDGNGNAGTITHGRMYYFMLPLKHLVPSYLTKLSLATMKIFTSYPP